jgi:ribosome biogenesis GTPase / thiamine phosphate phosphatase
VESNVESIVTRTNLLARHKGDSDRFSLYKRILQPIAANLDCVVIVASAKDPRFQPGFIDRYMLLAQSCDIPTIVCISKGDLTKIDDPILKWYEESLKIAVVYTSSNT